MDRHRDAECQDCEDSNAVTERLDPTKQQAQIERPISLDELWPVHNVGAWPEGMSLRREDLYDERVLPA